MPSLSPPDRGTPVADAPAPPADRAAHLRRLTEQLPRLLRVLHAWKSLAVAGEPRERAALVLLFPLTRLGPLRQSALAELVHADPSTVSRHVAWLVEHGLVRRVADETDGRVTRLVATAAGGAAVERLAEERTTQLGALLAGWPDPDVATFTDLFDRLLGDLTAALPSDQRSPVAPPVPREKP